MQPFDLDNPAWAQVITNAAAALATFLAVVAAFVVPGLERRRRARQFRVAFFACTEVLLYVRGEIETNLIRFDPRSALSTIRERRAIMEYYAGRESPDVSSVAALIAVRPELEATEAELQKWVAHIEGRLTFDASPFRRVMTERAERVSLLARQMREVSLPGLIRD